MRIDWDERKIACSVGDLVADPGSRRIGGDRGESFRRMWLGQDVHTQRATRRAGEDPNYRSEVSVVHDCERAGWKIRVSGRIDGLSFDREARRVVIEEVKSLHFDLELQPLLRSEKLQRHLFQLMLYACALGRREEFADCVLVPQLVLIDLVTGDAKVIEAEFVAEDAAAGLGRALDRLIEGLETERALRIAKRAFAEELAFPYERMRPFQAEMIDAVARTVRERELLLVSAPTGVGKTIAAIYPALREALRAGRKLFYLTPKTLQQEMAVAALGMLNDGSFRTLRVRAKQKMCAHTEVICHEDFCPFAAKYQEKMQRNGLVDRIASDLSYFDPDVIFEMARDEEVCPFEVSLELLEEADVVVCDYNYVFDPYIGLKTWSDGGDWSDAVLIIDEAHNLVDRARGYYSPEISGKDLDRVASHLASRPAFPIDGWEELLEQLRDQLASLAEELDGEVSQALCEPSARFFVSQRADWERIMLRYIAWKIQHRIAEEDDPLIDFYFRIVKLSNLLGEDCDDLARIIERTPDGPKLKIFCKDPARFIAPILESAHAVVAISATLQPFEFYRKTLGFPEPRTAEISLPSPFPRENRKVIVVSEVDTTYRNRALHFDRIAQTVASMAESNEGNFLALFPSYVFLREVSSRLPPTRKNTLVQRPDMTDWERRMLLDALRGTREGGTLVLAVSGGMYAEGIDYQGEMLSGVFVVGPALPSVSFEQELLKQYFDEQYGAGFEYAYLIPGMTRVVQSAGRVIRSERDVGVIALLCRRFTQPMYTRFFPAEWFDESPRELVTRRPVDEIRAFFEERRTGQMRLMIP
ncbi:MAG TPA: ATP-dependent DNA helicase [Thermoanaerobaculia bacterium]|nr:ATP-dependent DNA helicase [Thermoanaerobaculia bacterium]